MIKSVMIGWTGIGPTRRSCSLTNHGAHVPTKELRAPHQVAEPSR